MCGILGIVGQHGSHVNQLLYDGLTVLQHRGQDAAGILTDNGGNFRLRKSNGLVSDVFFKRHMLRLEGSASGTSATQPPAHLQALKHNRSMSIRLMASLLLIMATSRMPKNWGNSSAMIACAISTQQVIQNCSSMPLPWNWVSVPPRSEFKANHT